MTDEATNPGDGETVLDADLTQGVENEADEAEITDQSDDDGAEGADDAEVADDLEEVEHEGQTYKLPKALKPALMMQADYTRKTQELAEQRRNWEAERTQQAEALEATYVERGQLAAIDDRLAQFKQVDWAALHQRDPATATQLRFEYDALRDSRQELAATIEKKGQDALEAKREERAKRIQEGIATLTRDIPGFNAELAGKLTSHAAKEYGFSQHELAEIEDPRIIKVLHRLYTLDQKAAQTKQAQTIQQRQRTQPAHTLRGTGGKFSPAADTNDFASFEKLADSVLSKRA